MDAAEIAESVDIVEYISQYIDLEQRVREFWGLSCFTDEKTPSFSVDPEKRTWMDFSSGTGGNLYSFIMKHDNLSISEAINKLKSYAHINESTDSRSSERLEATKVAKKYRSRIRAPARTSAKALPPSCMSQYEFKKDKLKQWVDEGISWPTLSAYNVRYDAFNDRIVYPIKDYDGNIISICGRTCNPNYKERHIPKYIYLNSIGALDTIYGYSDNKAEIERKHEIILFEGAKSCMKAFEWGIRNTGALLTSHLSVNQFKFLIKLSSFFNVSIVFALDSDVDISTDKNIRNLCSYAKVQWVKNRGDLLNAKDSPVDQGRLIFEELYRRRENCEFRKA